jgi:hypothetical protein
LHDFWYTIRLPGGTLRDEPWMNPIQDFVLSDFLHFPDILS